MFDIWQREIERALICTLKFQDNMLFYIFYIYRQHVQSESLFMQQDLLVKFNFEAGKK